ncbi:MAG: hypothetical protein PHP59_11465 [Methanofollis sp.]|uniref:hypothetical protein n=1 Tax=Methanofollis sp. TaxID=2052835 RepID=UPI002616E873|nr:hypothetical protein [Methanofollis sp.]MDD4255978.1 hypothetical protein [Methanofollis sp.]
MMTDYEQLAAVADRILDEAEEDDARLAGILDGIADDIRRDLLTSDLLNALQVYYYYFREYPGDLPAERLMLAPASETLRGVLLDEVDIFELIFGVDASGPAIVVTDGEKEYGRFRGAGARKKAEDFVLDELA